MFGPILAREWMVSPRRLRFYAQRVVFVLFDEQAYRVYERILRELAAKPEH